jgi:hypothetical protein
MPRAAPRHAEPADLCGWRVDDRAGHRLGTVAGGYADPGTGAVAWLLIRLGRYSSRFVLAPPADALAWRGRLCLPYDRAQIERAPLLYAPPEQVGPVLEERLRRHYVLDSVADVCVRARSFR